MASHLASLWNKVKQNEMVYLVNFIIAFCIGFVDFAFFA